MRDVCVYYSCGSGKSRMRRKGFLRAHELIDKLPMTTMPIRHRKMTKQ